MSLSKADTRLSQAVDILAARSNKGLKERLIIAWTEALVRIEPEDLPTDLRSSFEDLVARLTHRGTIQNTLQEMGDGDIDNIIRRITGLAHAVEQEAARLLPEHKSR